jgi:hypothetical protein
VSIKSVSIQSSMSIKSMSIQPSMGIKPDEHSIIDEHQIGEH